MQIHLHIPNPRSVFNDNVLETLDDYDTEIEVRYGGGSSGKSQGVYQKYILKALKHWRIPRRIVIWRKVGATLRDSCWQHCIDVLRQFGVLEYCKINKSDLTIILPNKAELLFKGLDDPEKAKSIKGISDQILEEATEFTEDDFTQLMLRIRDKDHEKRQTVLMFNPISKVNWVYSYFFIKGDPRAKLYNSTYKDNRFLDEAVAKNLEQLRDRNPAYYRIYALGEFATLDKLVIPVYERRLISADEVAQYPFLVGLDFGYINDPSALVQVRYDKEGKRIFITGEYVKGGMLNDQIAKAIHDLALHKEVIKADSAEKKSIDEIKALDVPRIEPVKKWQNSVIQGLQWLAQHAIIVGEQCFKTIEELENYTWKKDKKTGEYINEPVDGYNHTIDALRYALSDYIEGIPEVQVQDIRTSGI